MKMINKHSFSLHTNIGYNDDIQEGMLNLSFNKFYEPVRGERHLAWVSKKHLKSSEK
jgi:hypothetical protein